MARIDTITDKLNASIDDARAACAGDSALRLSPISRALALALCSVSSIALANPQDGVVQAGQAKIQQTGPSRLDIIQSTQRAAINWRSFSIGRAEHVNFQQPSASAATLNRVVGADPSVILGRLSANGQVFLINPNGMLFGQGAKIDVGGLIASTTNLSNENFMAGRYTFDGVSNRQGTIVNRGEITAAKGGLVALVAPGVENTGVIRAQLGKVALASGNAFTLDLYGDKLIRLVVEDGALDRLTDVEGRSLRTLVANSGRIEADGGSVLLEARSARSVLDSAINMSGTIQARSFEQRPGEIVLYAGEQGKVEVSGRLDASAREAAAQGGRASVLGKEIDLAATSRIDVSGQSGGGTALVGGDWQGGNTTPRATSTTVRAGAQIAADALDTGYGGKVVVWADGGTHFAGEISARGGARSGDGGNVEVSGKQHLHYAGLVDASAPKGRAGNLLLDPLDWLIGTAEANAFSRQLRLGTNVTLQADRDIEVNEGIDGRGGVAGASLALNAGNQLRLNNDLLTNNGAISLTAGAGGVRMGNTSRNTGNQGALIYAGAAPININSVGPVEAQHLITTGAIGITTTGANGYVYLNRNLNGLIDAPIGSLTVSAAGSYDQLREYLGQIDYSTGELLPGTSNYTATSPVAIRARAIRSTGPVALSASHSQGEILLDGTVAASADINLSAPDVRARHSIFATGGDITVDGRLIVEPWGDEIVLRTQSGVGGDRVLLTNTYPFAATDSSAPGSIETTHPASVFPRFEDGEVVAFMVDWTTSQVTLRARSVEGRGGRISLSSGVGRELDPRADQQRVRLLRTPVLSVAGPFNRETLPLVPLNDIRLSLQADVGNVFRASPTNGKFEFFITGLAFDDVVPVLNAPALRLSILDRDGAFLGVDREQTVVGPAGEVVLNGFAGFLHSYRECTKGSGGAPCNPDIDSVLPQLRAARLADEFNPSGSPTPPGPTGALGATFTEFVNLQAAQGFGLIPRGVEETFVIGDTQPLDDPDASGGGGRGASQSADLGLAFAPSGSATDIFRGGWHVAGLRGFGVTGVDGDYFGLRLFDYLARLRVRASR